MHTTNEKYIIRLMEAKFQEHQLLQKQAGTLCFEVQMVAVLLLVGLQIVTGWLLKYNWPPLYYVISDGVVSLLLLAAVVLASIVRLWPRSTFFPACETIQARIDKEEEEPFEEFLDMLDASMELIEKSLIRKRALLMSAQICIYCAIACLIAAFIVGICLFW